MSAGAPEEQEPMDTASGRKDADESTGSNVQIKFEEICQGLNLDKQAREKAWDSYMRLSEKYGLEGDCLHWLACSLYAACLTTKLETVSGEEASGSSVSLSRILRDTNLSLLKFFSMVKNWAEMDHLDASFHNKVCALERTYEVASVIFNKYCKEFRDLFSDPDRRQSPVKKQRKAIRNKPPTAMDLFNFGWTLYIYVKGQYPQISDDLVNSHSLLLCCMDTLYNAVLLVDRRDLLNTVSLKNVLPVDFEVKEYEPPSAMQCILGELCKRHSGIERECCTLSKYNWWPKVKELFEKKTFLAEGTSSREYENPAALWLSKMLTQHNFHRSFKNIAREYELFMLQAGEFDERMFLSDKADEEIGTPSKSSPSPWGYAALPHTPLQPPKTPLSNRHHLESRADIKATPVSKHTQLVHKLQLMLMETPDQPSRYLMDICQACPLNPLPSIKERLKVLSEKFLAATSEQPESPTCSPPVSPDEGTTTTQIHLKFAITLYYRLLEAALRGEESRAFGGPPSTGGRMQQEMLEHDHLQSSLFACALELVLFSYKSNRVFPWVVECLGISPFHFYKILEPIIKEEAGLTREMVKHLAQVEEMVLEYLAWLSESPLFDAIDAAGMVPTFEEVHPFVVPTTPLANRGGPPFSSRIPISPLQSNPRLGVLQAAKDFSSPLSARDRYSSPLPRGSPAVRRLFSAGKVGEPSLGEDSVQTIGQLEGSSSSIQRALQVTVTAPVVPAASPCKVSSGLGFLSPQQSTQSLSPPKRLGSLGLFYRKVYILAYVRIKDLCERLNITEEIMRKIWTIFEYSLTKCPDVMRDRHLDQLVMCAVYVMSKVLKLSVTFQEIMRQYRHQPQAKSHVYRSVLLNNGRRTLPTPDSPSDEGEKVRSPPAKRTTAKSPSLVEVEQSKKSPSPGEAEQSKRSPSPGEAEQSKKSPSPGEAEPVVKQELSGMGRMTEGERGDIIHFYNKVYIGYIKEFALRFQRAADDERSPQLSPMPIVRRPPSSPRQVSKHQKIFVSPHKGAMSPLAAARKYEFTFQKSPRRDLQTINSVLRSTRSEGAGPKRNLMASLLASPQPLECGLPAAKRMALPPIGLAPLPSTSQEHMSAIINNIQVGSHPLLSPTSKQHQGPPL